MTLAPQLTAGVPAEVTKQKTDIIKLLDQQSKTQIIAIDARCKSDCHMLRQRADAQKQQFVMRMELETQQQEGLILRKAEEEKMALRSAMDHHKSSLEQQAMNLAMDYEKRKASETLEMTSKEMAAKASEMQQKFNAQLGEMTAKHGEIAAKVAADNGAVPQPAGIAPPMISGASLNGLMTIAQSAGHLKTDRMPRFGLPPAMSVKKTMVVSKS